MWDALVAIVLGVVEGLTEFLPISSTGHLIVAGHALGMTGEKADQFEIFIQFGAILAVMWEMRRPLLDTASSLGTRSESRRFAAGVLVAFAPAAVAGLALHGWIEENLFSPRAVAAALITGGIALLAAEAWLRRVGRTTTDDARALPLRIALLIGLAQTLALYPGVSRSAATIVGGLLCGLTRRAATEFSFYLAIPTLGAACMYSLLKAIPMLTASDLGIYAIGFVAAFVSALIVVRVFLGWVRTHDFTPFAIYRIAFGLLVLAAF